MITLANKNDCTGCKSCFNACRFGAISFVKKENGFEFPTINFEKCVNCGNCQKACPIFNNSVLPKESLNAFACKSKSISVKLSSSSSGVFFLIAEMVLDAGGVVFGASWDDSRSVKHIGIYSKEELPLLLKSKYVQSDLNKTFLECKNLLESGRFVLFSGTPCQIHGLKCFLKKEYEQLLTIDLVCHGAPSQHLFSRFLDYFEKTKRCSIKSIDFRYKNIKLGGYLTKIIVTKHNKEKCYLYPWQLTSYMWLFMNSYSLRQSCYVCRYASTKRYSDITLGDYWGIESHYPLFYDSLGVNMVLINTEKGASFFSNISNKVDFIETSVKNAIECNQQLREPTKCPNDINEFNLLSHENYKSVQHFYKKHSLKDRRKVSFVFTLKQATPLSLYKKLSSIIHHKK